MASGAPLKTKVGGIIPTPVDAPRPSGVSKRRIELDPGQPTQTLNPPSGSPTLQRVRHRPEPGGQPTWVAAALDGEPVAPRRLHLGPGTEIPGTRYRVLGWIGDGGMGVVYEAEHLDIERRVALKVLRSEISAQAHLVELFREEARIAGRVGSQNIVEVYDFIELPDGRWMIAMELLRGRSLLEEINDHTLDVERTIAILRQVCKGLGAAHEAGVVHRDIKPDNIMLQEREQRVDHVKILDFGIASIAEGPRTDLRQAGTPQYLAPEIIKGDSYDDRADIYAVGCMAYQMLSGHVPFSGDTAAAILSGHLETEPQPLAERCPVGAVPTALADVVMRCLAKEPAGRFDDVRDLEAAICEAQIAAGLTTHWDHLPLPDVEPARRERLVRDMPDPLLRSRWTGRRWAMWGVLFLGLASAATAGVVYSLMTGEEAVANDSSRRQVELLVHRARAAGAKAHWVYPPAEYPDTPTGLTLIEELEGQADTLGSLARDKGGQLREEFTTTLVRIGDEYWEREGGMAFAIDYYAQALVLTPEHEHARERASLTVGELAALRRKARSGGFSEAELADAEILAAMAEPDEADRRERVRSLVAKKKRPRSSRRLAEIEGLVGEPIEPEAVAKPSAQVVETPADPSEPEPEPAEPIADSSAAEPTAPAVDKAAAKERAKELAREGQRALSSGKTDEAVQLFHRALASYSRNVSALSGLRKVYFERGDYSRAVKFGTKVVKVSPKHGGHRIDLGDALYKALRYSEAKAQYLEAQALGHPKAAGRLAKVKSKLGG